MEDKTIIVDEQPKEKVTTGRVAHLTAAIILLVLASIAVFFVVYFGVEFFTLKAEHAGLEDSSAQLGNGIGQVVMVVLIIIGAVVGGILSLISLALSISVWRLRDGKERVFGVISTVMNSLYIITCVAAPFILKFL